MRDAARGEKIKELLVRAPRGAAANGEVRRRLISPPRDLWRKRERERAQR